ncbi:hypothetical protein DICPUDRAFT_147348, partial [Dictyostelium purpureum]
SGKIVTEELSLVDSDTYARLENKNYGISLEEVISLFFNKIFVNSFLEITNLNLSKINSEKEEIYEREFEGGSKNV